MNKIKSTTIKDLYKLYQKLFKIKSDLNKNQKLVITLDTETTGKYYNKFQAEQANTNIIDKIIEIGAIFSIEENDFDKIKKNISILDENKEDIGFRMFFNPFLDKYEHFYKEMPIEPYEVHGISKLFLEGKDKIEISNEILAEPAPSIHDEFLLNNKKVTYIEYLMKIINLADVFIAHNAPFDVGMINEAVNDQNNIFLLNEITDRKVEHYKNEIIDTLKLFRDTFPRQRLIAKQQLETSSIVNHKLDYLMFITKQPERNLHGAYWDSKLLIDSYSVFLDDILKFDILKNIIIKKTEYLNNFNLNNNHNKIISINKIFEKELEKIFNKSSFFKKEEMKKHLELQLKNINKGKKNFINKNQIDLSIIYFKIFFNKNKHLNNLDLISEQFLKVRNKLNEKLYEDMKTSKIFTKKELNDFEKFIKLNKNNEIIMSHYLVQALFHFYKYKIEQEVLFPIILDSYKNINNLISKKQENTIINIEKNQKIIYFRSDGSIATKNNSLTTVIGSINDWNSLFLKLKEENITNLILMDFNSIVNYIKFEKALKEFNKNEEDFHISINYGLTTLCKVNEFDFEINIISKNEKGFKEFPQILANTYKDKIKNEEAYKNPYINIEYFKKINSNKNLYVTLGGYEGFIERVLFSTIENKEEFIFNIIDKIYNKNSEIIIETYQSDIFLYEYKKNIINKLKKKYEKIKNIYTEPLVYLENDREYHEVRCSKYNDKIYDLKNLNIIQNYKENNMNNNNFKNLSLEETFIPKDPVIIPSLISDINFIKERRPKLYKELTLLKDENGNSFNLEDNSSKNVNKIQLQYFRIKAREGLEERFVENNISKEAQEYYNKRFAFEMKIIEDMKFDGYTLLVDDFLKVLVNIIGGLIGPGRGCLTKETKVITYNNGKYINKNIDKIKKGDFVISHTNEIKKVTDTFVYDINEELLEVGTFYSDSINPIKLTKDHKIYLGNNNWSQAQNLITQDYLLLPIPKYKVKKIKQFNLLKYSNYKNFDLNKNKISYTYSQNKLNDFSLKDISNKTGKIKATIQRYFNSLTNKNIVMKNKNILDIETLILTKFKNINEWKDYIISLNKRTFNKNLKNTFFFRKFLGRWIGDGCIRKDLSRKEINIVFHKNDFIGVNETLAFIKENGYAYSLIRVKSIVSINIQNKFLHSFINNIFKDYNFESNSKYFPEFVFSLPDIEIKDILSGYIAANGHIMKGRIRTATVSKRLAEEIKQLLFQLGIPSSLHIKLKEGNSAYTNTFPANQSIYNIPIEKKGIYKIEKDFIKLKIRKINVIKKDNIKVYDFTVEDNHSYTTTNYIVHNSAAGSVVSWGLRITEVDPMLEYKSPEKHLLFERYLNPERISLPDIDMDMNGLINKNNLLVKLKKLNEEDFSKTINDFILIIENKYEVEEYVAGKALIEDYQTALYGKETIAKIVTRDTYQAKSAIAAVCKYLGDDFARTSDFRFDVKEKPYIKFASIIAGDAFEKVGSSFKKVFDSEHDLYNKYLVTLYNSNNAVKKVVDLARKLEGTIANYGVHAAGLVILDKENNYLNNGYMIIGGINVTLLDGKHVEDYINIKFDFLGLASLEEIDKTLQFIEKKHGKIEKEKALSILSNEYKLYSDKILFERIFDIQNTKKIFQFSSDGMQDLVKRVKPDSFDDLVAITALYRPGPMDSGMTDMYVDYKNNPEKIFYEFKELEQILKPTYSTIVFQEQVMKIVQELGGFSLGGADLVRRAMGKKIKEELDNLKGQFIDGTLKKYENNHLTINTLKRSAIENKSIIFINKNKNMKFYTIEKFNDLKIFPTIYTNENIGDIVFEDNLMKEFDIEEKEITKLLADNLFENIIKFAGYGFNKSHSVAYTNVSMRMAWLKAHYPLEFFASILVNNSDDIDKLSEYIIDSKKNNVSLFGININKSNYTFDIIEDFIIYGLSNIKGISNNDIKFILKDRNKNGEYKNFADFLKRFLYSGYKGSLNTIEHLINVGAFDSISLNKEDLMKVKSSKINLNLDESKLEKLNKILMKQLEIENGLFFDFNYFNSMTLEEKAIELFNLNKENINVILPLLFNKILNSEKKQLNLLMRNKKSTINSFEKNINSFNEFKEKIEIPENYILNKDLKLKRNLLNKLTKLIDSENISESFLEAIENDLEKSIIEISKIEYDLTGSTSSFGSILENEYIINKIGDYKSLNILNNNLKQDGQFLYTSTLKNIISGENNEGKIYTNLVIEDINHIEKRFYLNSDQIFRFKNNLEIGDILLLDIKIKENNEKFYEKLINIEVFKENQDFKRFKAFNDPKLSINDLKIKEIKKEYDLNLELYSLKEIENDWENSHVQWPKLKNDENFKVILFLNGYKEIISKKTGKKYQIIEVTDGLNNNYLELLYSDLNLNFLEENKGNPLILELQKNKENGFGISAGYQTGLIFIDKKFINKNYKSTINLTPVLDGKTHINIYTKGKTILGRMLSNLSTYPIRIKYNNKVLNFKSLEGYWFFYKILLLDETERFEFLNYDGFKAKEEGSKIVKNLKLNKIDELLFQKKIKEALTIKIVQNKDIFKELLISELPLFHYFYDNENKVKELPQYDWIVNHISRVRNSIKIKENYINKTDLNFNLKNNKIEIININNNPEYDFYCGRPKEGQISPLGNPFKIDYNNKDNLEEQREVVLNKYDKYLRKSILNDDVQIISELENIINFIKKNKIVKLGCFCAPKRCHCESIKKELKEIINLKIQS